MSFPCDYGVLGLAPNNHMNIYLSRLYHDYILFFMNRLSIDLF